MDPWYTDDEVPAADTSTREYRRMELRLLLERLEWERDSLQKDIAAVLDQLHELEDV